MFITVKLLNGYPRPLTYKVPSDWCTEDLVGAVVRVPLRTTVERGLVTELHQHIQGTFTVREAILVEEFPPDEFFKKFVTQLSEYHAFDPIIIYRRLCYYLEQADKGEAFFYNEKKSSLEQPILTAEQRSIVDDIMPSVVNPLYQPIVLHGVTGSGKTEVYKALIKRAYAENRVSVILFPDVSLAVQCGNLLRAQMGDVIPIFGFHSASSITEKRHLWNALMRQEPLVIVGVHLPLLLPIPSLGLIVVDEEHDPGYQEKQHPRLHTRDLALMRAQVAQVPVVLGSATPSLNTLHNVQKKSWKLYTLNNRFAGAFPRITVVPLVTARKKRPSFWISNELEAALRERLATKEQSIIFLNRRGYSFCMQCSECATVLLCEHCSVSLTLHDNHQLICHYCGMTRPVPDACLCKSTSFLKKGIGTQQVVAVLQKMFPAARVARADLDATVNKKRWQATVEAFSAGEVDILVGTQTIIKGYHFPRVTLVGVIWADSNLNLPLYHAAETTLQQLLQVAGRAGRAQQDSDVIVQTMGNHKIFSYLQESKYYDFCAYEMEHRKLLQYPPYVRLASIELRHKDEGVVERDSVTSASFLANCIKKYGFDMVVLGPAPPLIHKVKNVFIRTMYLKGSRAHQIARAYKLLSENSFESALFFTQNPLH